MTKKEILGVSPYAFLTICVVLILGIIVGSFSDFNISVALSNQTEIGDIFQKYGNSISHLLYAVAGACLFKGLKRKGKKYNQLAWGTLILSIYWTVDSFLDTSGKYLRALCGYVPEGEGSFLPLILSYMIWVAIAMLVARFAYDILDDENANLLIAIGAVILISGIFGEVINEWLKVVGCRPRYRYLVTLENPINEYRNWWQMIPYLKDESSFRSWPSGHMTKSTIMFTLPMLAGVLKTKKDWYKYAFFTFAVVWNVIMGYNRIHMNAHFLTDVCFGTLITYLLYAFVYKCVFSVISEE